MSTHFDKAFELVLGHEGNYVNDPRDPGGETKYGISKRQYPHLYIASLTIEQAKGIYRADYWEAVDGDELPWPLNCFVFDAAVNQGVDAAIKMMQRALDTTQDGVIGRNTKRLAKASGQWHWARFMGFRAMRYQGTRNFDRFGEGWLTRIFSLAMEVYK